MSGLMPDPSLSRATGFSGHECHQATLLANGKVLITGGTADIGTVPGAELYDTATGTFALTGSYVSNVSGFNSCQGAASALLSSGSS
jgi:hypothetical protein